MSSDALAGDVAVETVGLTKVYHVYARPEDRLKQMLWPTQRKFYREFVAVRGVDLTLRRGETVGIVGRNGSGKSTLLKMICGTLKPTSGELRVNGHVAPILTIGAGFNPEFTGRENVRLNAAILGLSDRDIRERLNSIIEFADIGEFFEQPVKSYSSGMYSRLAFAVAINADPDILVVDEVLAVGDEAFTRKCFSRIEEIKAQGSTILFVSHSPNMVIELCDRALLMEGGIRLLTSDPKTAVSHYQKLLYSSPDRVPTVLEEIRAIDRGETPRLSARDPRGNSEDAVEPDESLDWGHFDPDLQPESTVEYESRGARISDPRILDPSGERVNVLRSGKVYTYAYQVCFDEPVAMARFGMMLKVVSGFELAGQASHPARSGIERVDAGSVAQVRFQFRALLVPGTYFMNAGVLGVEENGGELYLHRILDAVMFRIDPSERMQITGAIDLSESAIAEVKIESGASA